MPLFQKLDREQLSEDSQCKEAYEKSMSELKNMLHVIDGLQCEALQCLLNLKDGQNGASSGFIFLHKFREFLKENLSAGRVSSPKSSVLKKCIIMLFIASCIFNNCFAWNILKCNCTNVLIHYPVSINKGHLEILYECLKV